MRKIKIVILCLFLLAVLVACSNNTSVTEVGTETTSVRFNGLKSDKISIISDAETGCKYIFIERGRGSSQTNTLSPLMRSDGLADCGQPE